MKNVVVSLPEHTPASPGVIEWWSRKVGRMIEAAIVVYCHNCGAYSVFINGTNALVNYRSSIAAAVFLRDAGFARLLPGTKLSFEIEGPS